MLKLTFLALLTSAFLSAGAYAGETCYGGPGYYPYPCPPPTQPKICYGGPGNYPYPCPTNR